MKILSKINYIGLLTDKRFNKYIADLMIGNNWRTIAYDVLLDELKQVTKQLDSDL